MTEINQKESVDVIIPVYNGERFIAEALLSVVAQNFKPGRIIVVDDGSTDKTKEVVNAFKINNQVPIEYIHQTNKGLSGARNTGIKASRSEFIAFLDHDDVWLPNKLHSQLEIFRTTKFKNLAAVYGDHSVINTLGKTINETHQHTSPSVKGNVFDANISANHIIGSASCILIKRSCLDDVGYFDENLKAFEDWDLWLRIARKYEFDFTPEKVVQIRKHENNMQKKYIHMLTNEIAFYNKWELELEERNIPIQWRKNLMTLIFLNLPSIYPLIYIRKHLSKNLYLLFFSKYGGYRNLHVHSSLQKNMEKNIEIDVIIPLFNGQDFITEALSSVVAQTLRPKNIFVVDDGSTDNSEQAVMVFAKNPSIPIIYIKKENGGPNSARNVGIIASKSEYLAFLDADDVWLTDKLEKQIELFKNTSYKNLGLVYCDYSQIDTEGSDLNPTKHTTPTLRGKIFEKLLEGNVISGSASAVLINRSCFDKVGFFDENLRNGEDWDMWLRIAMSEYEFDFVPVSLVKIRSHKNNAQKNKLKMFEGEILFYNKWINLLLEKKQFNLIPKKWSLRILKSIITRLPKIDFLKITRNKLSPAVKKILITKLI